MKKIKTIALLSLSSGIAGDEQFKHRYQIGKERLIDMGFEVVEGPNSLKGSSTLWDNPKLRADDLNWAFSNKKVDLIISNTGGIDSDKLYSLIDWENAKNNKKPLLGFSDTTSLHFMFLKHKIPSYYGPSLMDGFAENVEMFKMTKESFEEVVLENKNQELIVSDRWTSDFLEWEVEENQSKKRRIYYERHGHLFYGMGQIKGKLIGGCLDTIYHIMDKQFWPPLSAFKGSIIFLETSENEMPGEQFAEIIQMLSKEIEVCSGLIVGKPKGENHFFDYLKVMESLNKPFVFNLNFGHTQPQFTIKYNSEMTIDFENRKMTIKNDEKL